MADRETFALPAFQCAFQRLQLLSVQRTPRTGRKLSERQRSLRDPAQARHTQARRLAQAAELTVSSLMDHKLKKRRLVLPAQQAQLRRLRHTAIDLDGLAERFLAALPIAADPDEILLFDLLLGDA